MAQRLIDPSILRPQTSAEFFDYERHPPSAPLDELVEHFWAVVWDLPPGTSYAAQTLPYPSINLSVTNTEADVTGLIRRSYHRNLTGSGYAIGTRFRPGCFRPLVDWPVSLLTDRHRPISEVLGRDTSELRAAVAATDGTDDRVALLADFLLTRWPPPDPTAQWVAELVALIAGNREVLRVAQVSAQAGVTTRTCSGSSLITTSVPDPSG